MFLLEKVIPYIKVLMVGFLFFGTFIIRENAVYSQIVERTPEGYKAIYKLEKNPSSELRKRIDKILSETNKIQISHTPVSNMGRAVFSKSLVDILSEENWYYIFSKRCSNGFCKEEDAPKLYESLISGHRVHGWCDGILDTVLKFKKNDKTKYILYIYIMDEIALN
ncbi:hypothetical protein [Govanella unica]|uniref:Uncharacterized protein n=1 Tax=Govanella unica TaxID=2975056 RepID=A0A9X3Z888_9PROT|nr:hypothetical protein [Govania unica]MDA5194987.1 hypothetical protein [Govania unica]